MANTITSANSIYQLSITNLYDTPQQLQGYAADRAFETDAVDIAELVLGVDGILSAGFIPYLVRQTISIMPDSLSNQIFEDWIAAEAVAQEKLSATAQIALPSIGRQYTLSNGFLTSIPPVPTAAKVLQARAFGLTWGLVTASPF